VRGVLAGDVEGGVAHFTSCATFPQSALRKGGATGKVRHATLNKNIGFLEGAHPIAAELTT